ncbi:MAG TPA: alpha/beta hydrolase [Mucilaginibacter sp.]|nr:alpha/beta hydrolase [Mucilaginibacter sp.]
MKKIILNLFLLMLSTITVSAQQKKAIPYGNNKAAGKYYDVRGIKMYTETYGTGKPLLLIHGNGGSIRDFTSTIPYFSKKYKVIAVDSRAHGKTVDSKDSLSFEMMADDFAGLLDKMHIKSAYVIGWSDGGINALVMAMRHPKKVIKLASTGANLTPDSSALRPSLWKDMVRQYEADKNKPRKTAKEKNDWKIFMLDYVQPNIPFAALKAIKCPSLIICGDHDLIPIEHTTKIYQAIPQAYLWVVPNSGHGTLIEHKDDFNKVVSEFFAKPYHKF